MNHLAIYALYPQVVTVDDGAGAFDKDGNKVVVDRIETTKSIDPDTGLITYEQVEHTNEDRLFKPAVMDNSGDAFFCGDKEGHFIRVGQRHYLSDWSKVNTNDNASCVPGLHCGGLTYIRGYQHSGTETHNILVDPMHIGAVPFAGDGAIRVKEYFVLDAFSGVNGAIYHSSTYAKQTDARSSGSVSRKTSWSTMDICPMWSRERISQALLITAACLSVSSICMVSMG